MAATKPRQDHPILTRDSRGPDVC